MEEQNPGPLRSSHTGIATESKRESAQRVGQACEDQASVQRKRGRRKRKSYTTTGLVQPGSSCSKSNCVEGRASVTGGFGAA